MSKKLDFDKIMYESRIDLTKGPTGIISIDMVFDDEETPISISVYKNPQKKKNYGQLLLMIAISIPLVMITIKNKNHEKTKKNY